MGWGHDREVRTYMGSMKEGEDPDGRISAFSMQ